MSKAQEIGQKVQGQTLDAVRKTQDAVVEAVTAWTETANKIPGYAGFTKQFPATEVIDSNFDFAQQILTSQRAFAGRIVAATTPKAITPNAAPTAAKKTAPAAAKKSAPAAAKKSAARKTATAAKKSSAVQPRATAE